MLPAESPVLPAESPAPLAGSAEAVAGSAEVVAGSAERRADSPGPPADNPEPPAGNPGPRTLAGVDLSADDLTLARDRPLPPGTPLLQARAQNLPFSGRTPSTPASATWP